MGSLFASMTEFKGNDYETAFNEIDTENTGKITKENMVRYIRSLVGN